MKKRLMLLLCFLLYPLNAFADVAVPTTPKESIEFYGINYLVIAILFIIIFIILIVVICIKRKKNLK